MRERVLYEIRRLADAAGGKAPGRAVFAAQTGIREHEWNGIIWSRWSDAVKEAGYAENTLQTKYDTDYVLLQLIKAYRHYGKFPTIAEMKLYRRANPAFPNSKAIAGHFDNRATLIDNLERFALSNPSTHDVAALIASHKSTALKYDTEQEQAITASQNSEGYVYLLKSGDHYKVGRSSDLERRVKELRVALPDALTLVHAIRTDDPSGIEAYWHRRFATSRANGEWFKLSSSDFAAFKRRKYQ